MGKNTGLHQYNAEVVTAGLNVKRRTPTVTC
jgi:hypothetical protein